MCGFGKYFSYFSQQDIYAKFIPLGVTSNFFSQFGSKDPKNHKKKCFSSSSKKIQTIKSYTIIDEFPTIRYIHILD